MECTDPIPINTRGTLLNLNVLLHSDRSQNWKIPHAFQQQLSHEKTPTLCNAFPAFEGMKQLWEDHQLEHPETYDIIQEGLNKLEEYRDRADDVPAYVFAMRKLILSHSMIVGDFWSVFVVINPNIKLSWYETYRPEEVYEAKELVLREVNLDLHFHSESIIVDLLNSLQNIVKSTQHQQRKAYQQATLIKQDTLVNAVQPSISWGWTSSTGVVMRNDHWQ